MEGSEDESPGGHPHGTSLEDALSDDFGLGYAGARDGTDLRGKPKEDKTDTSPPWSELKTKAGKERKRLPLACIACRRKKIRCSGEKPACKHCLRSRTPCVYKVTARKAAPRTDYMAMLDKRLKRMEERIIKIVPKSEQGGISVRANVKPAIPGTLPSGKGGPRKRRADEAFGAPDLDAWTRAPGPASAKSPTDPAAARSLNTLHETKLLQEGLEALPPKDIQLHLADVFFEHVYGQAYHILHRPSYMKKLRAGELPPVLVLSVCAVSARFSHHPIFKTDAPAFLRGEEWAIVARDIVTKRYEWPNITILNCLLLLGLHEFGTCQGGRSWSLAGQAFRMAFALQLHKDLEHDPLYPNTPLSFIDREVRRRTMWACFVMDRFISSGTDRPSFIREETLRISLPVKEKNFQLGLAASTENLQGEALGAPPTEEGAEIIDSRDNMGVAAYIVKAIAIWGRAIRHLNQGGKDLDVKEMWEDNSEYAKLVKEAEDLARLLPESLVYNTNNFHQHSTEGMVNQFVFLHIVIQQNILFLNRFAVSSPRKDIPMTFVTNAGKKAFEAADRISELLRDSEAYLIVAPFTGYAAFLASTVHIFGAFSIGSSVGASSMPNLNINFKYLKKMKQYWGVFDYMTTILREDFVMRSKAKQLGTPPSEAPCSTAIFQYGDWFDHFPHGVSRSDFMDSSTIYKQKEEGEDAVLEQKSELQPVGDFLMTAMSPQSKQGSVRSGSVSQKRNKRGSVTESPRGGGANTKNIANSKKRSSSTSSSNHNNSNRKQSHHQLEPLMTSFRPDQFARLQHQGHYPASATLGDQTSSAVSFADLGSGQRHSAFVPAPSPILPVNLNSHDPFGGGGGHVQGSHQHNQAQNFSATLLSAMRLAPGTLQMDSMLGGYGPAVSQGDLSAAAAVHDLGDWGGGTASAGPVHGSHGGSGSSNSHNHMVVFGHEHDAGVSEPWAGYMNSDDGVDMDVLGGGLGGGMGGDLDPFRMAYNAEAGARGGLGPGGF